MLTVACRFQLSVFLIKYWFHSATALFTSTIILRQRRFGHTTGPAAASQAHLKVETADTSLLPVDNASHRLDDGP